MLKKYVLSLFIFPVLLYSGDGEQVLNPTPEQVLSEFFANPNAKFVEGEKKSIQTIEFSFDQVETQKALSADKHEDITMYRVSASKREVPKIEDEKRTNQYTRYIASFKKTVKNQTSIISNVQDEELQKSSTSYRRHGDLAQHEWFLNDKVRVIKKSGSFFDYFVSEHCIKDKLFLKGFYYQRLGGIFLHRYKVIPCTTDVEKGNKGRHYDSISVKSQEITVTKNFDRDKLYLSYWPTKLGWTTIAAAAGAAGVYGYSWLYGNQK